MRDEVKRDDPLAGMDVAVQGLLGDAAKRERKRHMTQEEREQAEKSRAKREKDAARDRVTYDIPAELKEAIIDIAEREGVPHSGVAGILLAHAVRLYHAGDITFDHDGVKAHSTSPKYEYRIDDDIIRATLRGYLTVECQN